VVTAYTRTVRQNLENFGVTRGTNWTKTEFRKDGEVTTSEIFAEVAKAGARLVVVDGKLKATPPGLIQPDLKAAILERIVEIKARLLDRAPRVNAPIASPVIEATFTPTQAPSSAPAVALEFPPCPVCGATRYWVSRGFLRCGSKRCESQSRFFLTRIEVHSLQ
jgi:hypothetical protein